MSFNANDYAPTQRAAEAIERAEYEIALYDEQQRMRSYDACLCSLDAAIEGGARYERELADSMLELREGGGDPEAFVAIYGNEHVAAPVAEALNGWRRAMAIAMPRKAA